MANKHMKSCSTSLVIEEREIQTTMRQHVIPIRMAVTKKTKNQKITSVGVENSMTVPQKIKH